MRMLSPPELENRHQGVPSGRLDGVGDRLLETKEFGDGKRVKGDIMGLPCFAGAIPGWGRHIPAPRCLPPRAPHECAGGKDYPLHGAVSQFLPSERAIYDELDPRFRGGREYYGAAPLREASWNPSAQIRMTSRDI